MATQPRPALFLDRDGVINIDHGHVAFVKDFELIPGIFELCRAAQNQGYALIIATNQGGIARGLYTEENYQNLMAHLDGLMKAEGIHFTGFYHCPHHPEHGEKIDCMDRKPHPGMLLRAAREHNLDISKSLMVGDKQADMQAAKSAGVPTRVFFTPPGGLSYFTGTPPQATHHHVSHEETIELLQGF